jgi:hypothetical protein
LHATESSEAGQKTLNKSSEIKNFVMKKNLRTHRKIHKSYRDSR